MGWVHCGFNATHNKEMGYGVEGICSHPGCTTKIDHGLSFVCGGMHEGGEHGCGNYFCSQHLFSHLCDESCALCCECLKRNED